MAAEAATGHLPGDLTPPPRAGLKPNFAPENAEAYQSAVATTRAEKERFGQGGVGQVLRPGRYGEDFRVAEGDVPRQIFTRGPSEPTEVGRFINAVGGPEKAASIGQEVLTSELRERGIITPEGLINPNKFAAWQRGRAPTIEQFPGLGEKFANAQQAQITLDQTIANHATALRDFQNGVAKNFLSADPQVAVDRVFSSGNSAGTARQLFDAVKDNPDALAGTRRGFIDHLERKFNMGEGETNPIKAKQFRDFMGQHRNAFKIMFGGQGAQNIELVEAMLDRQARAKQVEATLGSNTARKALSAGRHGAGMGEGARTTLFALIGEHLAENAAHLLGAAGAVGTIASGAGVAAGIWAHALKQAGIVTKNDLGREMMLNPELTRTLMQRAPANEPLSAVMQRHVAAALRSGAIAGMNERTSK